MVVVVVVVVVVVIVMVVVVVVLHRGSSGHSRCNKPPQPATKWPTNPSNHTPHLHRGSSGHSRGNNPHNHPPNGPQTPLTTPHTYTVSHRAIPGVISPTT